MQRGILFFLFFSFSPKKALESDKLFKKRRKKKALSGKRTDEGAEKRKKKAGETRKKYHWRAIIWAISGRLLFHPPVGMEGTGRVCLAAGWRRWRVERQEEGVEKEKWAEVNECMGHLNLKTVQHSEYSRALSSLKGPVSRKTE